MTPKTLTYYDYHLDIEPKLCEYMGIEREYFRNYHKLVGGEYKDCWHVLCDVWDGTFKGNDTYFKIYSDVEQADDLEEWEFFLSQHPEYEWATPLLLALNRLHLEYGNDDTITVWISW